MTARALIRSEISAGVCTGRRLELFFSPSEAAARADCSTCSVLPECLDDARSDNDTVGFGAQRRNVNGDNISRWRDYNVTTSQFAKDGWRWECRSENRPAAHGEELEAAAIGILGRVPDVIHSR